MGASSCLCTSRHQIISTIQRENRECGGLRNDKGFLGAKCGRVRVNFSVSTMLFQR